MTQHDAYAWLGDAISSLEGALELLENTDEYAKLQGIIAQVERLQRLLA